MDLQTYLRFVLALVAVLALIGALAWLARRYGVGGMLATGGGGRLRRLAIVEVLAVDGRRRLFLVRRRSEEHTSELQSLMRISYAVFCLKKKKRKPYTNTTE